MVEDKFDNILNSLGFVNIGTLKYRINIGVWWHPQYYIHIIILPLGSRCLLKGFKDYFIKSIAEEGESWAREMGPLQDFLESSLPEIHISFSHFRDITSKQALLQIKRRSGKDLDIDIDDIAALQRQLEDKIYQFRSNEQIINFTDNSSDLMDSYIRNQSHTLKRQIKSMKEQIVQKKDKLTLFENLQRQYQEKGSAACYSFSFCSNLQVVESHYEFKDAALSIIKELQDLHRYQVSQKLNGGRLNIHIEEAKEPAITWIEQWFGGSFAPRQMTRAEKYFSMLQKAFEEQTMITAKDDINVDGAVKEDKKLLAAHIISAMVRRMDKTDKSGLMLENITARDMPINIGLVVSNGRATTKQCKLPFAKLNNFYTSGITGSGKSFTVRVIMEEVANYSGMSILVIDPGNQSAGLLVPEDREEIIDKYREFGLKEDSARGFKFDYYAPAFSFSRDLPSDLGKLARARSVISLKNLDDEQRCEYFADVVNAVFNACSDEESERPRLLIVVEEAHRFTKKRVVDSAKKAAERAEIATDRLMREGRKFGIISNCTSQSIKDYGRDFVTIRQNTPTKIFMNNSDREIDYAADFLGDGRQITRLKPGTGIFYNSSWGSIEVKVRPPFSKVWDFSEQDTMKIFGDKASIQQKLSPRAENLLAVIENHYKETNEAVNISQLGQITAITSKRALQQLITELEEKGKIQTYQLAERGRPRVIKPLRPEVD
ncbi:MAG: ATP-binding protein [Sedimentisphaerales bacterium]|nr:ATP-binding protein [Sedimentisphaerales bacterium]